MNKVGARHGTHLNCGVNSFTPRSPLPDDHCLVPVWQPQLQRGHAANWARGRKLVKENGLYICQNWQNSSRFSHSISQFHKICGCSLRCLFSLDILSKSGIVLFLFFLLFICSIISQLLCWKPFRNSPLPPSSQSSRSPLSAITRL